MKEIVTQLEQSELDGIFLINDSNIRYLSGYTGADSFLLQLRNCGYLITDYRYTEQAKEECNDHQVITIDREMDTVEEKVAELLNHHALSRIGFEKNHLTWERHENMQQAVGDKELVATIDVVESLRYKKNASETNYIAKAAAIADEAFTQILPLLQPGISELDAVLELELLIRKSDAENIGFPIILVAGPNSSKPHGIPSSRKIERGDLITLDFGAQYQGYRSDMTRTVVIGEPDDKQRKVYDIVKEAQQTGVDAVKAGVTGLEVNEQVRDILKKHDYLDFASKGLGHGLGLDIHEKPFLNRKCQDILEPGCVITIEPGVYIPDWGGVRIEDTVVVTEEGCEILTKSTKELLIL